MKRPQFDQIKDAINTIVSLQTLPPQIDYISPSDKAKGYEAERFLDSLDEDKKQKAYTEINERINSYYSDDILGMDGQYYSVADLDAMF